MIFDGNAQNSTNTNAVVFPSPVVVDFGNGQAQVEQVIGQLRIVNNANVFLSGPSTANTGSVLTVGQTTGFSNATNNDDFFIDATSQLTLVASGNTGNRFLQLQIGVGKKGLVNGNLTFSAGTGTPSRLTAKDAGALVFASTSTFTATSVSGSPFGNTNANTLGTSYSDLTSAGSVIFTSGATYLQQNGLAPFGNVDGGGAVTSFAPGSNYVFRGGTFSTIGQTYGNLQLLQSAATNTGTQSTVIANNLTVGNGTITGISGDLSTVTSPAAGVSIGGNITVYSGNTLSFNPASASDVALNGSASQTIGGAVAPTFGANATLAINNSSQQGITLNLPLTVVKGLALTLGLVNTTAVNLLTLPSTAIITGGSNSNNSGVGGSFVNGPVARTTTGSVTNLLFPVGKVSVPRTGAPNGLKIYRPMTLATTNQASATTYVGEQIEMSAGGKISVDGTLDHVSSLRYFKLTPFLNNVLTQPTGTSTSPVFSAAITLTFNTDDFVTDPSLTTFVVAKRNAPGLWTSIGHSSNTTTTLTSAGFPSFSDFSLASTVPTSGFPGINPLPVELTRFEAQAKGQSVNVSWATASEKNNDHFDVQRSATGEGFATIGTVKGQGNSSSAHEYAFTDGHPLAGQAYYRLRQVDADGSTSYSPVVAVQRTTEATAYPNPTAGSITLPASSGPIRYRVLNSVGQTLLSGQAAGTEKLDLSSLPKGTFFLELTTASGRRTQRLLRE